MTGMEVMGLLRTCADRFRQTVVLVTHQEAAAQMADRVLRMSDGRLSGDKGGGAGYERVQRENGRECPAGHEDALTAGRPGGCGEKQDPLFCGALLHSGHGRYLYLLHRKDTGGADTLCPAGGTAASTCLDRADMSQYESIRSLSYIQAVGRKTYAGRAVSPKGEGYVCRLSPWMRSAGRSWRALPTRR